MSAVLERQCAGATEHRARHVVGMPQSSYAGLSENWLLKECGDRHWQALAHASGRLDAAFRDAQGRRAYAAFTAVRVVGAELGRLTEGVSLDIVSRCSQAGGLRQFGLHEVHAAGACRARVEMLSAFVRHGEPGSGRRVVRAAGPALPTAPELQPGAEALVERRRALRERFRAPRLGEVRRRFAFTPCPNADFNAARLLYFASFQAIVDRAEWHWFGQAPRPLRVDREMVFHANLDVGDAVEVVLNEVSSAPGRLRHWCEVRHAGDGRLLADVSTRKEELRPAPF